MHNLYNSFITDINKSGNTIPAAIITDFLYGALELHDCLCMKNMRMAVLSGLTKQLELFEFSSFRSGAVGISVVLR
jgi:hypothetical protein